MELEEFRELALQSIPKVSRGRTVRYTLVRTPGEFFLSKIHRQQYLGLRSIPLMGNYRFIQSTLTHGEYTTFREDFFRDFNFLKIRNPHFSGLVETARELGFRLHGFSASGKGRIDVKSPPDESRPDALVDLMNENQKNGMIPFSMTFRKDRCKVTIRKDFNFFLHGGYWEAMPLIYKVSRSVIENDLDLLEKLSGLLIDHKVKDEDFLPLNTVKLEIPGKKGMDEALTKLERRLNTGLLRENEGLKSVYAIQKGTERSAYRIDFHEGHMEFLPTMNSKIEGILDILDLLEVE